MSSALDLLTCFRDAVNLCNLAVPEVWATADYAAKSVIPTELLRLEKIVVGNLCLDCCDPKLPVSVTSMAEKKRKGKHRFGTFS